MTYDDMLAVMATMVPPPPTPLFLVLAAISVFFATTVSGCWVVGLGVRWVVGFRGSLIAGAGNPVSSLQDLIIILLLPCFTHCSHASTILHRAQPPWPYMYIPLRQYTLLS